MAAKVLAILFVLTLGFIVARNVDRRGPPVQGSLALCEMSRLGATQDAWDFWMGPYGFFPCKQLPLEANV